MLLTGPCTIFSSCAASSVCCLGAAVGVRDGCRPASRSLRAHTYRCSFVFHTFSSHEREAVARRLLQLDLIGICLMIGGSFLPGLYYGFYCFPLARRATGPAPYRGRAEDNSPAW